MAYCNGIDAVRTDPAMTCNGDVASRVLKSHGRARTSGHYDRCTRSCEHGVLPIQRGESALPVQRTLGVFVQECIVSADSRVHCPTGNFRLDVQPCLTHA